MGLQSWEKNIFRVQNNLVKLNWECCNVTHQIYLFTCSWGSKQRSFWIRWTFELTNWSVESFPSINDMIQPVEVPERTESQRMCFCLSVWTGTLALSCPHTGLCPIRISVLRLAKWVRENVPFSYLDEIMASEISRLEDISYPMCI